MAIYAIVLIRRSWFTRSCSFADRNSRDRVISSIAIYVIVLFLVGPGFEPRPNSMIFFIGPGFNSQARLPVSGQCDSWPMSMSTCRTAHPFGSLIALLMICCLCFLTLFLLILLISWTAASSSLLKARKCHLRCLSHRDGALCLRSYIALIQETSGVSTSFLLSSRGLSMFIHFAALRRFCTSGTLPSCHRSIHFRMDCFHSHWLTVGLNSIVPSL